MGRQPILLEHRRDFPVPPGELWELLADTDQVNREIGMPLVAYGPVEVSADAFYRKASARFWGLFAANWREFPFEWVRGERYAVLRLFDAGFLEMFYGGLELRPQAQGTRVRLFAEVTPRTWLGWSAARLMGGRGIRDTLAYFERMLAQRNASRDLPGPRRILVGPVNRERLARVMGGLRSLALPEPLLQRFARHLGAASDREVLRMQPFGLADDWGADRMEVLRLFARAARLEGLYHTWEVMCPNCRVPLAEAGTLRAVPGRVHCEVCAVAYDADLAENVELRYSVHPALRTARHELFCIGGPANFPHVWVQQYLLPGTERRLSVTLAQEAFRARVLRANVTCPLVPESGGPAEIAITYREDGWYQMRQRFSPGSVTVRLRNETGSVIVVVIEQERWDPRALTAAAVLALPERGELLGGETGR